MHPCACKRTLNSFVRKLKLPRSWKGRWAFCVAVRVHFRGCKFFPSQKFSLAYLRRLQKLLPMTGQSIKNSKVSASTTKKNCGRCGRSMVKCALGSRHRWIQQIRNVAPRALNFSMRAVVGILLLLSKFAEGCSVRGCRRLGSVTAKISYGTFWHLSFPQTTIRCCRDLSKKDRLMSSHCMGYCW